MTIALPLVSSYITPSLAAQLLASPENNMEGDMAASKSTDAIYVYSLTILTAQVQALRDACSATHIYPRYAMKANHNAEVMRLMTESGIDIDASSTAEAEHAMALGIAANRIQITSQQRDGDRTIAAIGTGCRYVACSLHQLEQYCVAFPGSSVGVRINPGIGSGAFAKVNTGGPASSFGIWHEYIDRVHAICARHGVRVTVLHTHIGSGSNPLLWQEAARMSCSFLPRFPDVTTIDLGGGIKTPRMPQDKPTDIDAIIRTMREVVDACIAGDASLSNRFAKDALRVEIEPGTYLVANCGGILCRVGDISDTGADGYTFLKLTTGMDAILRPAMYGAQHHIVVLGNDEKSIGGGDGGELRQPALHEYVVVGHCCESSDIFTPDMNCEDGVGTRMLPACAIGDYVVIEGCGAYCESMSAKGYNGFEGLGCAWVPTS